MARPSHLEGKQKHNQSKISNHHQTNHTSAIKKKKKKPAQENETEANQDACKDMNTLRTATTDQSENSTLITTPQHSNHPRSGPISDESQTHEDLTNSQTLKTSKKSKKRSHISEGDQSKADPQTETKKSKKQHPHPQESSVHDSRAGKKSKKRHANSDQQTERVDPQETIPDDREPMIKKRHEKQKRSKNLESGSADPRPDITSNETSGRVEPTSMNTADRPEGAKEAGPREKHKKSKKHKSRDEPLVLDGLTSQHSTNASADDATPSLTMGSTNVEPELRLAALPNEAGFDLTAQWEKDHAPPSVGRKKMKHRYSLTGKRTSEGSKQLEISTSSSQQAGKTTTFPFDDLVSNDILATPVTSEWININAAARKLSKQQKTAHQKAMSASINPSSESIQASGSKSQETGLTAQESYQATGSTAPTLTTIITNSVTIAGAESSPVVDPNAGSSSTGRKTNNASYERPESSTDDAVVLNHADRVTTDERSTKEQEQSSKKRKKVTEPQPTSPLPNDEDSIDSSDPNQILNELLSSTTSKQSTNPILTKKVSSKRRKVDSDVTEKPKRQATEADPVIITPEKAHLLQPNQFSEWMRETLVGLTQSEILSSKWLRPIQLKELGDVFGLSYKKGRFNSDEVKLIESTIAQYASQHRLSEEGIQDLIMSKRSEKVKTSSSLFQEIGMNLPGRDLSSIWKRLKRDYHPKSKMGTWTLDEDQRLVEAVKKLGKYWIKVSEVVGRSSDDCRDRWRNVTCVKDTRQSGKWTKEEEMRLTSLMKDQLNRLGKEIDCEGLWTAVSEEMGGTRSRQQCRVKWVECLKPKLALGDTKPIWKHQDILILIQQLIKYEMKDEIGFDWKLVPFEGWEHWTPTFLHRRWNQIKRYHLARRDQKPVSTETLLQDILKKWLAKTEDELQKPVRVKNQPTSQEEIDEPKQHKAKKENKRKAVNAEKEGEDEDKEESGK